jgi:hypothetical protein
MLAKLSSVTHPPEKRHIHVACAYVGLGALCEWPSGIVPFSVGNLGYCTFESPEYGGMSEDSTYAWH